MASQRDRLSSTAMVGLNLKLSEWMLQQSMPTSLIREPHR